MQLNNFCGIDIGCTNIKMMAIVDNIPITKTVPSGDNLSREKLISTIIDFYNSFNCDFLGLGIAFSGYTADSMKVEGTSLPCLKNFSIEDLAELNCDNIRLINDSNATTLAGTIEYPNSKVLVGITNGTGIGCGISISGNLFTGSSGFLGEIYGNLIVNEKNSITKIGHLCSGSKILKKLNNLPDNNQNGLIEQASIYLGILLVNIIHLYNPDVIYFSGGGFSFNNFLDNAINFAKQNAYSHFTKKLTFAKSSYKNYSGCIGAIKLVSQKIECL